LANPGIRLAAWVIDWVLLLPVVGVMLAVTLALAAPHFGPIFPVTNANNQDVNGPTPGFVWIYLVVIGYAVAAGLLMVAYQTVANARYGRSFGKAWLHIRPVRLDGGPLGWGRSLARATLQWVASWFSWIGLLDPLWCLWDGRTQCLHDKAVETIVINDPAPRP